MRKSVLSTQLVSVIIPTYNSSKTIATCLRSLSEQTFKKVEVVIVDNHSDDGTEEEVHRVQRESNIEVKFFKVLCSRSEARNWGARVAKGGYLLHLDSDMELSNKVIEECVSKCERGLDAIIIPEVAISGGYWSKCHSLQKSLGLFMPGHEGVRFIRKDLFDKIAGYDEALTSGEDFDLHYRIENAGAKIGRASNVIFHHEEHLTLKSILNKYIYYSKSLPKYYTKNRRFIKKRRMPTIYVIFVKRKLLLEDPIHTLGWLLLLLLSFIISLNSLNCYRIKKFSVELIVKFRRRK